jgi:hypothetical protein
MHPSETGHIPPGGPAQTAVGMCVNQKEFEELIAALDRSLALFGEKPEEPGFDLEVYEELRRVRETLIRARRDMLDKNVRRDSKSPLGSS